MRSNGKRGHNAIWLFKARKKEDIRMHSHCFYLSSHSVLFSLLHPSIPPPSVSLCLLLLPESCQEGPTSGSQAPRVQLWEKTESRITLPWTNTSFWDWDRGECAPFWRYWKVPIRIKRSHLVEGFMSLWGARRNEVWLEHKAPAKTPDNLQLLYELKLNFMQTKELACG